MLEAASFFFSLWCQIYGLIACYYNYCFLHQLCINRLSLCCCTNRYFGTQIKGFKI